MRPGRKRQDEMENENSCPVCNADIATQPHDMEKHREKLNKVGGDWKSDESAERRAAMQSGRHPSGRKLTPGAHRDGA